MQAESPKNSILLPFSVLTSIVQAPNVVSIPYSVNGVGGQRLLAAGVWLIPASHDVKYRKPIYNKITVMMRFGFIFVMTTGICPCFRSEISLHQHLIPLS